MKKRKIFAIIMSIVLIAVVGTAFAADSVLGVTEQHNVSSKTNSFVVNTTNSFTSSTYYVSFTTGASETTKTIYVRNNGEIDDSYDILLLSSTGGSVKVTNDSLNAITSESVSLTGLTASTDYYAAVINHRDYNVFVSSYLELQLLNNQYQHKMENNDTEIDDKTIVYAEIADATIESLISTYSTANGSADNFFYDNTYYTKNAAGRYVLARGAYLSANTYYTKTMVYSDMYTSNAYKNVYLLNNITVNDDVDANNPMGHFINFPCSINLLTYDMNLSCDYGIHHYYGSLFTIDTISGQINNDSTNTFAIETPLAYYFTSSSDATVFASTADLTKNCNVNEETYRSAMLTDAKRFVQSYLSTDCHYDSDSNGTDETYTIMLKNIDLPASYCDFAVRYEYLNGSDLFTVNRTTNNQFDSITVNIYYNEVIQTALCFTANVLIVGTSQSAIFNAYSLELEEYLSSFAINTTASSILIGNESDSNSLAAKYDSELTGTLSYAVSEDDSSYVSTTRLGLTNRTVNSIVVGQVLSRHGYATSAADLCYLQVSYAVNSTTETLYIPVSLQTKTIAERTEYISRYIQNLFVYNTSPISILAANDPSIAEMGAVNIVYAPFTSINGGTTWTVTDRFVIDTVNSTIAATGAMSYNSSIRYGVKALALYPNDSFTVNNVVIDATTKTYSEIVAYLEDANITAAETTALQSFISTRLIEADIVIPSSGVGGSGGADYVGSIFQTMFENYAQLLGSTGDFEAEGYYYYMEIDYDLMADVMSTSFVNAVIDHYSNTISESDVRGANCATYIGTYLAQYLAMNETDDLPDNTHAYSFSVDPTKVPTFDTVIYINAYITANQDDASDATKIKAADCLNQEYSFTIPGIYTAAQIPDSGLYNKLRSIYNNSYSAGDPRANYILVSEAQKSMEVADLRGATITNLTGVQYFTNTRGLIIDGLTLSGNNALDSLFAMPNLEYLSAVNCGLTDTNTANISNAQYLVEADLSQNNLTNIPTFYRRLTKLNISSQSNMASITNIENNYFLEYVNLEGNKISSFEPLKSLDYLKEVYVYGNTITGTLYGTNGSINIPVYVTLENNGVSVYTAEYDASKLIYDVNGNLYTIVYDSTGDVITSNTYTISSSNKIYDNNGVEISVFYQYNASGSLVQVTATSTEILLVYQATQTIKELAIAINSVATFSTYKTNFVLSNQLRVGMGESATFKTIVLAYVDGTASSLTASSNVYTVTGLGTSTSHSVIISLTEGTSTVYRQIEFEVD